MPRASRHLAIAVSLVLAGCATFPSSREHPVEHLAQVLRAYGQAHPERPFPKTDNDLIGFAAASGAPFDPVAIDISVQSEKTFSIVRYTVKTPPGSDGLIGIGEKLH